MGVFIAIALSVAFALALLAPRGAMLADMPAGGVIVQSATLLIAVALAASLAHRYRGRLGAALRDLLVWIAIGVGFIALYANRDSFATMTERIRAELQPGYAISTVQGVAEIVSRRDGHFVLRMKANGVDVPFLFDTGATLVTLRADDARRIGINTGALKFTEDVSTANGVARAAMTRIPTLAIGTITQRNVEALVAREGAVGESLLGQNFLKGLASYEVAGGRLILRGK